MSINKWPFYPDSIIEILGPDEIDKKIAKELLSTLESACAVDLKKSVSIVDIENRIDIDKWKSFNYAEICRYFRHEVDETSKEKVCINGDERCKAWDRIKAQEILNRALAERSKKLDVIFNCHLGLLDAVSVIYVISNPLGVLYSGQYIDGNSKSYAKQKIIDTINNLDNENQIPPFNLLPKVSLSNEAKRNLIDKIDSLEELKDEGELKKKMRDQADKIGKSVEDYWKRYKNSKEAELFKKLRENKSKFGQIKNQIDLSKYLKKTLEEVAHFIGIKWIAFFADWDGEGNILELITYHGIDKILENAQIHFNRNKSGLDFSKNSDRWYNSQERYEYLKKGIHQRNVKIENMIHLFDNASFLVPQSRGKSPENTLILLGPFEGLFDEVREHNFLFEIFNFIVDDFRHDNRYIRLVDREKQWEEIADFIAHQVKSVLQPISSGIDIIIGRLNGEEWITEEKVLFHKNNVDRHISHLAEHSKTTLASTRDFVENMGKYKKTDFTETNIAYYLKHLLDGYNNIATKRNIKIIRGNGFLKEINAEVVLDSIETALRNLIDNAIKYAKNNTDIIIDIKLDHEIIYWANLVSIIVEDNGYGIKKDDKEKIFRKGIQGQNRGNLPGEGIGLYESKKIIQGHGGNIALESYPRTNQSLFDDWITVFKIEIPLKQNRRN